MRGYRITRAADRIAKILCVEHSPRPVQAGPLRQRQRGTGRMQRRRFGGLCLALLSLLVVPGLGWAQDYPSRPIRLIITSPAGSLVDVLGRLIAEELGAGLGQTVVVDNRPGAMTQVGSDVLNRASADGYTLMIGTSEMT